LLFAPQIVAHYPRPSDTQFPRGDPDAAYNPRKQENTKLKKNKEAALTETQYISSDAPFGQGDIIQLPERPHPPHFGVVINADCDLLHQKTDGVCSYLPIYTFYEYLIEFWIGRFLESQKKQIATQITNALKQPDSDLEYLVQWLESDDFASLPEHLTDEFGLNKKTKSTLSKYVTLYSTVFSPCRTPIANFVALCYEQVDPAKYAKRQLIAASKQMGDGHMFLNEIHGQTELGFVIRTKRIYSIETDRYFRSEHELRKSPYSQRDCALRIAQLTTIMRFQLIQLFVHHFTRVGLPDHIRDMREFIVDDIATTLVGVPK